MTALDGLIGKLPMKQRPEPPDLGALRFLFITGKGGVGKTTVAGALGLALAARGKRVLIAMCNSRERLSSILATPPIGHSIQNVSKNLWAVNIDPEVAMHEYGQLVLKVRALTRAVFDNRYTKAFFRAVPGLTEWSILGKAWYHTTEIEGGAPRFDIVLLDAPATGHGLDMLRVPKVILDVVPPGVLRRDAEEAWAMFQDPVRAGVIVVTLPEEMPTTETIELSSSIQNELGLPLHQLVVNAVLPPMFSDAERQALLADPSLLDLAAPLRFAGTGEAAIVAGARRAVRERVQEESLIRLLDALPLPVSFLPHLFEQASTGEGTRRLAALL